MGGQPPSPASAGKESEGEGPDAVDRFPMGTRDGREVVRFLRQRGARIRHESPANADWAEAGSGDERSGDEEDANSKKDGEISFQ
jgi:hypothetical protein